jgi:hypothetical protein
VFDLDFVTFGGGLRKYRRAALRLGRDAVRTDAFTHVSALTHDDLDGTFRARHAAILHANTRGFGYWIWKPYVISQALESGRSEFLLYADAGCTLNLEPSTAASRLADYLEVAAEHSLCSFAMDHQPESKWTKRDLLSLCGISNADQASGQRVGGVLLLKRCDITRDLVGAWSRIAEMDGYHYLDDSPSREPENEGFIEHRHDQSILSCILKSAGLPAIADETFFGNDWNGSGRDFPLWVTRNVGSSMAGSAVSRRIRALVRSLGSGHQPNS